MAMRRSVLRNVPTRRSANGRPSHRDLERRRRRLCGHMSDRCMVASAPHAVADLAHRPAACRARPPARPAEHVPYGVALAERHAVDPALDIGPAIRGTTAPPLLAGDAFAPARARRSTRGDLGRTALSRHRRIDAPYRGFARAELSRMLSSAGMRVAAFSIDRNSLGTGCSSGSGLSGSSAGGSSSSFGSGASSRSTSSGSSSDTETGSSHGKTK